MSIEEHEWSDEEVISTVTDSEDVFVTLESGVSELLITREDAEALARHFGIITGGEE